MPPLAVYLVAQYARYEMRKMDAELEQKKKQEEEKEKEKEKARIEFVAAKDKEAGTDPELLKVKERLDKLEDAVKEIAVVSKEQLCCSPTKNQENGSAEEKHFTSTQPSNSNSGSESTKAVKKEDSLKLTPNIGKESTVSRSEPTSNASFHDQKGKTRDGGGATQNGRT
ncbi:vicilin-like seed storage protein [Quillaja saponaria]|nr:vicilin-like seed storage protein [Quillaja saponaria]